MFEFSRQQKLNALVWLSFFHISIIASSNYLVQLPFTIWGYNTTWGAFTFPFVFLTTDLTVRIFGAPLARRIIACVMVPALLISYVISALFFKGSWQGGETLLIFNTFVGRIALASFSAYVIGQLVDVHIFDRLRREKAWWVAPSVSAIFGNALDTLAFFSIAFYRSSDEFMAQNWVEISWVDYLFKITICALFFLPAYGVLLNYLLKRLVAIRALQNTVKKSSVSVVS